MIAQAQFPAAGTILIVDDQAQNLELLEAVLEREGHTLILAASGAAALEHAARSDLDLVLLDVNMPGMDGYEVCRRLRGAPETQSLPIILVTAQGQREARLRGIAAGANDYLTKPIDRDDLVLRVRNALAMRRLHRELARQFDELRRVEKLRDTLVHLLVHDLRSPLTSIISYADLARMDLVALGAAEAAEDLSRVSLSARLLADMVSNVLDVSRMEADAMPLYRTQACLRALAHEGSKLLAGMNDRVVLEFDPPEPPVPAFVDPSLLRRVIGNLVANAIKFTPSGGRVRISARSTPRGAELRVTDSGPGIAPRFHQTIFEKFGQVEGAAAEGVPSSGLGLTFCKLAVESHGGEIGVESDVGRGSTFWIRVPAA